MTMRDEPGEPLSDLEQEGIPELQGGYPGELETGVSQDGLVAPGDQPVGVEEFGTTAAEERQDEPLAARVAREEPDVAAIEAVELGGGQRVMAPDWGSLDDEEGELIGTAAPDAGVLSGEEAAMHVVGEDGAPGVSWDESPEYVGDEAPGGGAGEAPQG